MVKVLVAVTTSLAGVLALPLMFLVIAGGISRSQGLGTGGDTRLAWAAAFAARLGAPSQAAVEFELAWATEEGASPPANNPLNSSLPEPGSVVMSGNADGVRMYPSLAVGLEASVATIADSDPALGYQAIVSALRNGDTPGAASALQASRWCFDPTGPLGHECPGYSAAILGIVDSYRDPAVFARAGAVPAGTTPLTAASAPAASAPLGPGSVPVAQLLSWLSGQLGKPYVWGGTGPQGYDCSGLTMMGYAQVGVPLPRTAAEQYLATAATAVPLAAAQPGDLLFWAVRQSDPATIHHVAIYAGAGQIIEAATEGVPVHEVPIWNDGGLLPVATRPFALAVG